MLVDGLLDLETQAGTSIEDLPFDGFFDRAVAVPPEIITMGGGAAVITRPVVRPRPAPPLPRPFVVHQARLVGRVDIRGELRVRFTRWVDRTVQDLETLAIALLADDPRDSMGATLLDLVKLLRQKNLEDQEEKVIELLLADNLELWKVAREVLRHQRTHQGGLE